MSVTEPQEVVDQQAGETDAGLSLPASRSRTDSLLSLSGQSLAYGIGQFGRGAVAYLALPVLTRVLGQADYGIVAVMVAFISFTDVLSDGGLPAATMRLYNDSQDAEHRARVLGSSLLLFMLYALAMAAGVWIFAGPLAAWLLAEPGHAGLLRLGAVLMVVLTAISFGQIMYRLQVRPLTNSASDILLVLTQSGLALGLVALYGLGVSGYWWGQLAGAVLAFLFVVFTLRHSLHFSISGAQIKGLALYALPMIPAAMSVWALRLIDRPIILHFYTLQDVGVYELGYKIAGLVALAIAPFNAAWPQFAFSRMNDREAPHVFRDTLTGMAAVCVTLALGIFAVRRELVLIFGSARYLGAMGVISWVVVGQVALALVSILGIGPRISKRTTKVALVAGISAVANIALNFLLLPHFGIVGAAMATMLAYALQAVLSYIVGRSEYYFPIDYVRLVKLFAAAGISAAYVLFLERAVGLSGLALPARLMSVPLFIALLFASGFMRPNQLRDILKRAVVMILQRKKGPNYAET